MIQEIIVAIVGLIVFGIVLFKIYNFFFVKNENKEGCGCASCNCNTSKKLK